MKNFILFILVNLLLTSLKAQEVPDKSKANDEPTSEKKGANDKPRARKAISIGPLTVNFKLDAGQSGKQVINFINNTNRRVAFNIEPGDWDRDSLGVDSYFGPNELPYSCSRWVSLDKTYLEVMPKSKESVTLTMVLPDSADAANESKWSLLFIRSIAEKKAPQKLDGNITLQPKREVAIVARIFQTPPSANLKKEMKMLSFAKLEGRKNTYRISSQNTGSVMLMCNYTLDITSVETGEKTSYAPDKVIVLPGRSRYMEFELPDTLKKGKYTAIAMINSEDEDVPIEASQSTIDIE